MHFWSGFQTVVWWWWLPVVEVVRACVRLVQVGFRRRGYRRASLGWAKLGFASTFGTKPTGTLGLPQRRSLVGTMSERGEPL